MTDSLAQIAEEMHLLALALDNKPLKEMSERLNNERKWLLIRCEALAKRVNAAEGALLECRDLFSELRGDWSDNRGPCREGMMIIDKVLEGAKE